MNTTRCPECVTCTACHAIAYCNSEPAPTPCAHGLSLCEDCAPVTCAGCFAVYQGGVADEWLVALNASIAEVALTRGEEPPAPVLELSEPEPADEWVTHWAEQARDDARGRVA